MKKASKLKVSDAIDSATVYGDIRVRAEARSGNGINAATTAATNPSIDQERDRARYKMTLGVKTESGAFYTDLAMAMGANGRSDNATFGKSATSNIDDKEALFIKRAMIGFKATDWLTVEAGRMDNPLYTTPMVWDADLNFQGGAKYAINDRTSAKGALTYTTYNHNSSTTPFSPGANYAGLGVVGGTAGLLTYGSGVNNLDVIEIPAEINFMATSNIGVRAYGDYAHNTSGIDCAAAACLVTAQVCGQGTDSNAWLLGLVVGSAKDLKAFEGNKMAKGDWSARLWYQDVGAYSVDANAVDSDFMDSRVNMKGTTFKAQYNIQDNVYANFAYGHATRKNGALGTGGAAQDLSLNLNSFDLVQLDLTYKF